MEQGDRPGLGSPVGGFVVLVVAPDRRFFRIAGRRKVVAGDLEVRGDPLFAGVGVDRLGHDLGRGGDRRDGRGDLLARKVAAQTLDVFGFRHVGGAQGVQVAVAVELTEGVLESRLAEDQRPHPVVADDHAQIGRPLIVEGTVDHPRQDLVDQAQGTGLLKVDPRADPVLQDLKLAVEVRLEVHRLDLDVFHLGDRAVAPRTLEYVADAPDREAQDQEGEKHENKGLGDLASHLDEHGGSGPFDGWRRRKPPHLRKRPVGRQVRLSRSGCPSPAGSCRSLDLVI